MLSNEETVPLTSFESQATYSSTYREAEFFSKTNGLFLVSLRGKTWHNSLEMLRNVLSLRVYGLVRRKRTENLCNLPLFRKFCDTLIDRVVENDLLEDFNTENYSRSFIGSKIMNSHDFEAEDKEVTERKDTYHSRQSNHNTMEINDISEVKHKSESKFESNVKWHSLRKQETEVNHTTV